MIKDITLGQYLPGNSIVHKLDPRTKLTFVFAFMIILFIIENFIALGVATVVVALCYAVSKISFKFAFKGIKPVLFIVIFTIIINMFFTKGTPLFEWKFISISEEGLKNSILVAFRILLLITSASILTYTTTPISLTDAIEKIFNPLKKIKIPVHEMAMMMTIALRFIPTLIDETDKIMKAQAARGADIGTGNLIEKAKSFIPVLVPLFVSSFKRADDLAVAMEARCYRGGEGRTKMKILKFKKNDLISTLVFIIIVSGIITINYLL